MPQTPLAQVAPLQPYQARLKALGYQTLGQFLGAARAAGPALSRYLGTDVTQLAASLAGKSPLLVAAFAAPRADFPLGVRLEHVQKPRLAFRISLPAAVEPPKVDLIPQLPPILDQGQQRGTCVAFSSLAIVEHYAGLQGAYQPMSEEFLYWDCKSNDGHANEAGTWLEVAFAALTRDGCCLDSTWGYTSTSVAGNEGQGPPPSAAPVEAPSYKVQIAHQLAPTSVQDIRHELARGRCVAFSIPVFDSWYRNSNVLQTGDLGIPIPGEPVVGGHAMAIVGYEDLADVDLGGGRFFLRNSWGPAWAASSPHGPGYGTIPYAYIARFGAEAYSIE